MLIGEVAVTGRHPSMVGYSEFDRKARRLENVMKFLQTVTYALKATLQLAQSRDGAPIPCSRLAAQGNMPERFLLQILRSLVTKGILRSTRGVEGGYVLIRDDLSVLDVIEAIEGPHTHELILGEGLPRELRKKLTSALEDVAKTARSQLEAIKIAQLVLPRSGDHPSLPSGALRCDSDAGGVAKLNDLAHAALQAAK